MASLTRISLIFFFVFYGLILAAPSTKILRSSGPDEDIQLPHLVPQKIKITDRPADPAGKFVKVRYGPFRLPPNSMFMVLPEQAGGIKITKPCNECFLGAFQGGLEYEDGTEANVDTGPYLHHFVVVNNNKPDWLCGLRSGSMFRPQYIYNSGNERPPVRLNSKYKFGMRVDKTDTFGTAAELMNMSNETKVVYATTIYEVIPLDTPGYREATHLRMDVWMCGGSDVPAKNGSYSYTSPTWKSPYSGVILHNDGHRHDGTTEVKLHINGQDFCNSIQYYGLRKGWTLPAQLLMQHTASHSASMQYISDAIACEDNGRLEKGDILQTTAYYDETKYPQMVFKGHKEPMGISFLYIGRDEDTLKDKLPIEKLGDQLPLELGGTSAFAEFTGNTAAYTLSKPLTGLLGIPDLNNTTSLEAPLPPITQNSFGALGGAAITASSVFGQVLSPLKPMAQSIIEKMLPSLLPSLPKGFKLDDVFPLGGIVTNNLEMLLDAVQKDHPEWMKTIGAPQGAMSGTSKEKHRGGTHRASMRAIYNPL